MLEVAYTASVCVLTQNVLIGTEENLVLYH
jgi:hypothetical protein